jgi:hypothetical protein
MKGRTLLAGVVYGVSTLTAGIGLSFGLLAIAAETNPSGLITAGASAPVVISSVMVPPVQERSVMFTDRGRTYLVGVTTGKVIVVDGTAPTPTPPAPYNPPAPSLQGLSKTVYDSIAATTVEGQNRVLGAKALSGAIDSTLSEVGGLGMTDPQAIVNLLASNAEAAQVGTLLKGFKLGDILASANVTTKEQLLKAFEDIKTGLGAIK